MEYGIGDTVKVLTNKNGNVFKPGDIITITDCCKDMTGKELHFYMAKADWFDNHDYPQPIMCSETFDPISIK